MIYYSWNSLLFVTAAYNLRTRRFLDPFNLFCIAQVLLIFIGGDRTIPIMYVVVILRYRLDGMVPLSLFRGEKLAFGLLFLLSLPVLAISKSIYTYCLSMGSLLS